MIRSGRFSDRVDVYAASRPSYPSEAIDRILAGAPRNPVVADIGAGTGIASRLFASRGCRVLAVEPDAAMRRRGSEAADGGDITWCDGTGEATGLPDRAADIVVVAQAFHWMDGTRAVDEFCRVLRRPGRVALMWNVHDVTVPVMARYRDIMLQHATDPPRSPWYSGFNDALASTSDRLTFSVERFPCEQRVSRPGLHGRAMSSSYIPLEGDPGHDELVVALDALFDDEASDDVLTLHYETSVYIAAVGA